ncbi:MAG: diguanylate cyclase [Candidatus Delongbacteria bacterium]|nr:diguanylate cyclase [Candidatus Delongbacteria bacterium]
MDIKNLITKTLAEYFIPKVVSDFIVLTDKSGLTKSNFIDLVTKKHSYQDQILKYFSNCKLSDINTLSEAIDKLGIEQCAFAIFNISLIDQLNKNNLEEFSEIFEKEIFTAVASYTIAKESNMRSPWKAYLAGLYSNISYFLLYKHFPKEFNNIIDPKMNSISRINFEWETFGMTHSDISWLLLGRAGIPEDIREPVKNHHIKKAQSAIGKNSTNEISLAVYFGSMMTTVFYEDYLLTSMFKKDIKTFLKLDIEQIESLVTNVITNFRKEMNLLNFENIIFPGYFKIINWFDNNLVMAAAELKEAKALLNKEKKQRLKFQKVLESYNKKLVGIAIKDPLTGIYNRRYLTERLNDEFLKAKKYKSSFLIITCDIDHFKKINDTYGHGFGDEVLVKLVKVIAKTIRKADLLARIGGEEFIILCNQTNDYDGILIAEKVRSQIEKTIFTYEKNTTVPVTMSFGVANFTKDIKSVQELMELSDNRLYLAKENGRNRVVYTDSTNEALM